MKKKNQNNEEEQFNKYCQRFTEQYKFDDWLICNGHHEKLKVLSDVRCVCRIRRAQCPSFVSLQPPKQVMVSLLLFHPALELPQIHLVHSQVQGTVHLWTQEERIQNTLQNTLAP